MTLLAAALLIEGLLILAVSVSGSVAESILLLLLVHTIYLVAVYHACKRHGRLWLIIPAALIFRLTLSPLSAPFSDDLTRYRWEAMVQDSGGNPYQARPADAEWQHLRDSTYDRIPGKDFRAVYGPAWTQLSAVTLRVVRVWAATAESQLLWLKAPAALFDVATIFALLYLLRARGLPDSRVLIYAWAPLPVWEFWGNGHNDSVLLFFLVAALALAARNRPGWSSLMLGMAITVKWWPALLLPAFALRLRSFRTLLIAPAVVAVFGAPYFANVLENAQFMSGFVGGWRNNDSLFGLVLYLTRDQYHAKYLTFALIGTAALWLATRDWPLERVVLWTIAVLLLFSANVHPWYATWLIPLLAIYPQPALLLWVSLMPLAYSVLIRWQALGDWEGSTPERWWIYGPVFCLLIQEAAQYAIKRRYRADHCTQTSVQTISTTVPGAGHGC
jgi:alpha-1,6-mannosyltransferase